MQGGLSPSGRVRGLFDCLNEKQGQKQEIMVVRCILQEVLVGGAKELVVGVDAVFFYAP